MDKCLEINLFPFFPLFFSLLQMTMFKRTTLPSIAALVLAVAIIGSNAQQGYQLQQPQYNIGYQQYQQPQVQFEPQRQHQPQQQQHQVPEQQFQTQPQVHPGKVTGYNAQDLIPQGGSPLKDLEQSQGNGQYVDFINQLYRFDRTKTALHHRQKRALVFRPMFVYRQQKVRKERVQAEKAAAASAEQQSKTSYVSANQSPHYKDNQNQVYREYNSYYEPYRYGQRYPYRN